MEGPARRADGEVLRRRGADRAGLGTRRGVGEIATIDEDGASAQLDSLGERDGAGVDLELAGEAVGAGERDGSGRGLHDVGGAREDTRDGAGAEIERLRRGQ